MSSRAAATALCALSQDEDVFVDFGVWGRAWGLGGLGGYLAGRAGVRAID